MNIKTLKQATPNLRIINLYGISFLDDTHIEAFSSNCIQLTVSTELNLVGRPSVFRILCPSSLFPIFIALKLVLLSIFFSLHIYCSLAVPSSFSSYLFQVLSVSYCSRVQGASLKILLSRCRNLKCLMLQQTNLQSEHVMAAEWEKADQLQELDITATDLSKECLLDFLPRIPAIRWLSAGQLDGMTDTVLKVCSCVREPGGNRAEYFGPLRYN